jgi:1-acyl-sn-glycerol-3-phosphate acyltransferase
MGDIPIPFRKEIMGKSSTHYPTPPADFLKPRGWVWKAAGRAYLRLSGWRIEGEFPLERKFVLIVAPHTSNWDFLLGVAILFATEMRVSWLGKHALFKAPFRTFLRWLGGIPVDRRASHGVVGECVRAFAEVSTLMLALSPEGTRKGVSQWKTGFYQIAVKAGVPIFPVGFDYRDHVVRFMPMFKPSGDLACDLPLIQAQFASVKGLKERPLV